MLHTDVGATNPDIGNNEDGWEQHWRCKGRTKPGGRGQHFGDW